MHGLTRPGCLRLQPPQLRWREIWPRWMKSVAKPMHRPTLGGLGMHSEQRIPVPCFPISIFGGRAMT